MKTIPLRGLAIALLLTLASSAWGMSIYQFTFTQGGYPEGSHVTGFISLIDANGDGVISNDGPLGDSVGGIMRLHGHPTFPSLAVTFFEGWFDLSTLNFSVSGDTPFIEQPSRLINGFVETVGGSSRGAFGNLPGFIELSSTAPIVLTRVPDAGPSFAMIAFALAGLFGAYRLGVLRTAAPTGEIRRG